MLILRNVPPVRMLHHSVTSERMNSLVRGKVAFHSPHQLGII